MVKYPEKYLSAYDSIDMAFNVIPQLQVLSVPPIPLKV